MAKVVESFPRVSTHRDCIYPWDDWFDGQVWELTQGEDFQIKAHSMQSPIRSAARTRDLSVHICVRGDKVYIQASKKAEE